MTTSPRARTRSRPPAHTGTLTHPHTNTRVRALARMGTCCSGDAGGGGSAAVNTSVKPPKINSVKFCVADADGKMGPPVTTFDPSTRTFHLLGSISHKYRAPRSRCAPGFSAFLFYVVVFCHV